MPQNQGKLGNLLPLLAQLEQSGLARILVQEVGNVLQSATVVLRHGRFDRVVLGMAGGERIVGMTTAQAAVVLLLGHGGGSSGGLGMMLVRGLRVHPSRVGLWILVMAEDVWVWHHFGGVGALAEGGGRWAVDYSGDVEGSSRSEPKIVCAFPGYLSPRS
jgi:hypothetical protein